MKSERFESIYRLHTATGNLDYMLYVFGDELAVRHSYKAVNGIEAVHLYLINKHGWLPRDVRTMSPDDLRFALSEEMHNWTLPPDAR